MRSANRSDIGASVLRYLVAVWTVGLAFAATLLMSPLVPPGISPLFLLAVMISAWRGGLGAGLLATALSALANAFVFLPPTYSLRIDRDDLLQLAVFTFAAIIIGTLSAARRRAEDEREALLVREQMARVEAERANAVKDEFLAAVSHELRTPLTTIKTLTRVMQRRDPGEAERREYLEDIASECDRQIDLVHNLLDLSRIRAGGVQIKPQRVDAGEVVRACEKIERAEADEHAHQLIVELPPELPFVRADHSALRRALCTVTGADLIVVGSQGRAALGRFFIGSVSKEIATESRCSVRVARRAVERPGDEPVRIIIGVDGSPGAEAAVRQVGGRVWAQGTEVRLIAVDDGVSPTRIAGILPTAATMIDSCNEEAAARARTMLEWAEEGLRTIGLSVSAEIRKGDPQRVLIDEAHKWGADSIFVGSRGFNTSLEAFRMGSVSTGLVTDAPCSVEVVRSSGLINSH